MNNAPSVVVLLHGLGRSKLSMSVLGLKLRSHGYRVFNFGYRSRRHSIGTQARLLAEALRQHGLTRDKALLHFVAHSLGGIVVRRFALDHQHEFQLGRAVMLGPPNQGSTFATFVRKYTIIEKILGPILLELSELKMEAGTDKVEVGIIAGGTPSGKGYSPFVSGNNDGIVSVSETALKGAKDHLVVKGLHTFLMVQPVVIDQVLQFLQHGVFQKSQSEA